MPAFTFKDRYPVNAQTHSLVLETDQEKTLVFMAATGARLKMGLMSYSSRNIK